MKSIVLLAAVLISASLEQHPPVPDVPDFIAVLEDAYENQKSDFQIEGEGIVVRILSDDLIGSRHQRFILQISHDLTVLVAHNIDLAERLPGLVLDSTVGFYGEYEWNSLGGVIHWTHNDPKGNHIDGWLKYNGITYQ